MVTRQVLIIHFYLLTESIFAFHLLPEIHRYQRTGLSLFEISKRKNNCIVKTKTNDDDDDDDDDGWGLEEQSDTPSLSASFSSSSSSSSSSFEVKNKLNELRALQNAPPSNGRGRSSSIRDSNEPPERDLFIPIFSIVALIGLFGSYGYEMVRLASRGELYLPWSS